MKRRNAIIYCVTKYRRIEGKETGRGKRKSWVDKSCGDCDGALDMNGRGKETQIQERRRFTALPQRREAEGRGHTGIFG